MEKKRLSKYLAAAGVASRRACEELIFGGHVSVDGKVVLVPQTLVSDERIEVDGAIVGGAEKKVYFLLNKPNGFVCSNRPSKNSPRVVDLFPGISQRLFTVGRLDRDTTGLILVTNDGHFAQEVIHPSSGVQKEYIAEVNRPITPGDLVALRRGTRVEGVFVKPLKVSKLRKNQVKITVMEGKKHEVRILLAKADFKTLSLKRIRIGNLQIGSLPIGSYRRLSPAQCKAIFA